MDIKDLIPQDEKGQLRIIQELVPGKQITLASDIAIKAGDVYLGVVDRFSGTLIITGRLSEVETAMNEIVDYFKNELGYTTCDITRR